MSSIKHQAERPAVAADKTARKQPVGRPFPPGQSGNPKGRPKGARNKLTTEFFDDFYAVWQEHGTEALKTMAVTSPKEFVKAAAMLMPKEEVEKQRPFDLHEGLRAALEEMSEQSKLRRAERARLVNPPKLIEGNLS